MIFKTTFIYLLFANFAIAEFIEKNDKSDFELVKKELSPINDIHSTQFKDDLPLLHEDEISLFLEDAGFWERNLGQSLNSQCNLSANIWCDVLGKNIKCKDLGGISQVCEDIEVQYTFQICNSEDDVLITNVRAKIDQEYMSNFPLNAGMAVSRGACKSHKEIIKTNTCVAKIRALLDISAESFSGNYCSARVVNKAVQSSLTTPVPTASPTLSECEVEITTSCENSFGEDCILPFISTKCSSRPQYFDFKLTGAQCDSSNNSLLEKHFKCTDYGEIRKHSNLYIEVTSVKKNKKYFGGVVPVDGIFRIGNGYDLASDLRVVLYTENRKIALQEFFFHSSCSKDIYLGDIFGGLMLYGFDNKSLSIKSSKHTLMLKYSIKNLSKADVHVNEIFLLVEGSEQKIIKLSKELESGKVFDGSFYVGILPMSLKPVTVITGVGVNGIPYDLKNGCKGNSTLTIPVKNVLTQKNNKAPKSKGSGKGGSKTKAPYSKDSGRGGYKTKVPYSKASYSKGSGKGGSKNKAPYSKGSGKGGSKTKAPYSKGSIKVGSKVKTTHSKVPHSKENEKGELTTKVTSTKGNGKVGSKTKAPYSKGIEKHALKSKAAVSKGRGKGK